MSDPISDEVERVGKAILDCCFRVHTQLGPGLFEKVYETCLCYELQKSVLRCSQHHPVKVIYDHLEFDQGFLIDLLVEDCVVVELKAVSELNSKHESQLMTYLRLADKRLGFLINFNEPHLRNGIKRRVL